VRSLVSGVTASLELLEAAAAVNADVVLVHHGYFWRGEDPCLIGMKHHRIAFLMKHNMGLLSYHLPLDAHPEFGNNIQLAHWLGFVETGRFGEQNIAMLGTLQSGASNLKALQVTIERTLGRKPLVIGNEAKPVQRLAWCAGAAQSYFEEAIQLGVDAFVTGEISERTVHAARESDVAFIAAGHHATERYGVQALGEHISQKFGISHQFIDINSPV
jgi:dinuclear metal center YbgI/SA1388 family protein